MRALAFLLVLACGACRSSFRFEVPPDHPARPDAPSAQLPAVPDAARAGPGGTDAEPEETEALREHDRERPGKGMK